ncbi:MULTISPECIES: DUF1236 domain-containing protein [Phyllobacteriaceae]|uniref:DUF1236 domain-containing protein n=1 Tax=Ollibium composti TaxID=2675109 RepID=A0ABY2Q9U6_9HYPH|nr:MULTISPECIES: DUF1236 domain-containing protein [Mesorhizobium]QDB99450.1 DUF1236 domain-containing protein [Mesorhizobium sp. 8]THF58553.1 DUF1236 domain-containing protein [Mesorhizobium composti]
MRLQIISSMAGLLLIGGIGAAAAQDVIIQPEQQTVIKEYVHKKPLASINLLGAELSIGSTLPDTVELHEIPDVQYRYVVVNDRTVVVDPSTRKIVEVIE